MKMATETTQSPDLKSLNNLSTSKSENTRLTHSSSMFQYYLDQQLRTKLQTEPRRCDRILINSDLPTPILTPAMDYPTAWQINNGVPHKLSKSPEFEIFGTKIQVSPPYVMLKMLWLCSCIRTCIL